MKYLAIFLIIISISAQSLNVHSTVIHVQSSKGKYLKSSKAKPLKKWGKCSLNPGKNMNSVDTGAAARIGIAKGYSLSKDN